MAAIFFRFIWPAARISSHIHSLPIPIIRPPFPITTAEPRLFYASHSLELCIITTACSFFIISLPFATAFYYAILHNHPLLIPAYYYCWRHTHTHRGHTHTLISLSVVCILIGGKEGCVVYSCYAVTNT